MATVTPLRAAREAPRRGRPSKLTPELEAALCRCLEQGLPFRPACELVGIDPSTAYRWLQRGREEEERGRLGRYARFRQAVAAAEAKLEARLVRAWLRATHRSWQAAQAFLAARWPERWGPPGKRPPEETGTEAQPIRIIITRAERPPEDAVSAFD